MVDEMHQEQLPDQPGKKPTETRLLPETAWFAEPMATGIPPEDAVVVTIARQFGSGGSDIARLVAQIGGLAYIDQQIIAEVAQRSGVDLEYATHQDERTVGMVGHILDAMQASNPFNLHYNTLRHPASAQTQSKELNYLHVTQRVILELATQGNAVIVGRGSQFLLHNAPRTLHIYIFAPLPYRIETIIKQFQLNRQDAIQLIEQRDHEQDIYLRRYYGTDGHQPGLYHLLINTGLFSFENAADFICQALPAVKALQ
ncbi:MAG: cytidylate kinase-like family protein [Ktedonobacteraceae bacterium]